MRRTLLAAAVAGSVLLSGCSWVKGVFGGDDSVGTEISVFDVVPGQCFNPPAEVKAELATLITVPCDTEHIQEAIGKVAFVPPDGTEVGGFPGGPALTAFAHKACQAAFADYVGVIFQNSTLFYTFLLPSARSWEQDGDRNVVCFVSTSGAKLTASVKGTKQ